MPDILITEFMDETRVARMAEEFDVAYEPDLVSRQEDIPARMAGVRGLIVRNATQVRGEVLEAADSLVCVGRLGVGLDNIDVAGCEARGVKVFPATGANSDSVGELAMGALFVMFRRAYGATKAVMAGDWPRMELMGREVSGKRLGIMGLGNTGKALAWRARGCGMSLIAWDPYLPADDPRWAELGCDRAPALDDLFVQADAVSIHVPLTDETRHVIDAAAIAKMKDRALLMNLARGGIVHEGDVVQALKDGKLAGFFTDVFETEPLPAGSIFDGVPNAYLTPHVGARTEEAETRVSTMISEAVMTCLKGAA